MSVIAASTRSRWNSKQVFLVLLYFTIPASINGNKNVFMGSTSRDRVLWKFLNWVRMNILNLKVN